MNTLRSLSGMGGGGYFGANRFMWLGGRVVGGASWVWSRWSSIRGRRRRKQAPAGSLNLLFKVQSVLLFSVVAVVDCHGLGGAAAAATALVKTTVFGLKSSFREWFSS